MINNDDQEKNKSEGDWDEIFATSLTDQLEVEEMESNNIFQFYSMTPNKEFTTKLQEEQRCEKEIENESKQRTRYKI